MVEQAGRVGRELTSEAFSKGKLCYLRYNIGNRTISAPVNCTGMGTNGRLLKVEWTPVTSTGAIPPPPGKAVTCFIVEQGRFFNMLGEVKTVYSGELPVIDITVPTHCAAVSLRKTQRFVALGRFRLGDPGDHRVYYQHKQQLLDVSQGGFGVEIPSSLWEVDDVLPFSLDVCVPGDDGKPASGYPTMSIEGLARVCAAKKDGGKMKLGLAFHSINSQAKSMLQYWLTTFGEYLERA